MKVIRKVHSGFGVVQICEDEQGRKVIQKTIQKEQYGRKVWDRLTKEGTYMRKMRDSGYVPIIYKDIIDCPNGEYTLIEEYIEGSLLSEIMLDHHFAKDRKIAIMRDLIKAVEIMHSLGIVHQDLKPNNIIITEDDKVKLIDFGIAARVGAEKPFCAGNYHYASPVQLSFEGVVDFNYDAYSLGIIYSELFGTDCDKRLLSEISRSRIDVETQLDFDEFRYSFDTIYR
jgi:serine/threonine-protein kinase